MGLKEFRRRVADKLHLFHHKAASEEEETLPVAHRWLHLLPIHTKGPNPAKEQQRQDSGYFSEQEQQINESCKQKLKALIDRTKEALSCLFRPEPLSEREVLPIALPLPMKDLSVGKSNSASPRNSGDNYSPRIGLPEEYNIPFIAPPNWFWGHSDAINWLIGALLLLPESRGGQSQKKT